MNWMPGPQFRNDPNQVWNPKRLFVGLELPSSCKLALLALDPHLIGLRWLLEEQLHLTLGFIGDGRDTAHAALFLASDEARFITGTEIVVDGGMTARCD